MAFWDNFRFVFFAGGGAADGGAAKGGDSDVSSPNRRRSASISAFCKLFGHRLSGCLNTAQSYFSKSPARLSVISDSSVRTITL